LLLAYAVSMDAGSIRLGVDIGGTFTDVVLFAEGAITTSKVPTTADRSEGVIRGVEQACEAAGIDPRGVDSFRHATTIATNALLEGEGAQTALVTTDGFGDVLAIGRQNRPSLYDLTDRPASPLVPAQRRYELTERATPEEVETELDETELTELIKTLDDETESIAVSFLHAYATPENERRAVSILRERTDLHVVGSHEILSEFREYERTATTVADAFVTPLLGRYLGRLETAAAERDLTTPQIMQSNGGIAATEQIRDHAVTTALSGPAAGVVGASLFEDGDGVISFDMGGTSTDVGLIREGEIERTTDANVGGHPVRVPMVAIETVGAGGGSVAWVDDGGALRVGPESAGAAPGPACYGNGGDQPTVTDANLALGYLGADTTLGANLDLDPEPAERTLSALAGEADLSGSAAAARGVYRIATERMSQAVRTVTVREGHDPRAFALVAFGGAGPMHAAALADGLGLDQIRIPLANGVLSALGLLAAGQRQDDSRTIREPLDAVGTDRLDALFGELEANVRKELTEAGATVTRTADLRYEGQSHELTVEIADSTATAALAERFHSTHERVRGYRLDEEPIELVTIRVTGRIPSDEPELTHEGNSVRSETRQAYFDGRFQSTPVYEREGLPAGETIDGPAIFEGGESTVVVPPAWTAQIDDRGTMEVTR
jgi:N-methylhydantoinase A